MAGKRTEKLQRYLNMLALICGITGITGFTIWTSREKLKSGITYLTNKISNNSELAKTVCCIATIVVLVVSVIILIIIYYLQTQKLNKRISACKKALKTIDKSKLTEVTPVDYYLIDKDTYDEFKTGLKISKCLLEVIFIKNDKNPDEYDFKFRWSLNIKNSSFKTQNMAKFIYSGARDGEEEPHLRIKGEGLTIKSHGERNDIKVLGVDRFVEIEFSDGLKNGEETTLYITYVFKEYKFDRKHISIWLVPDALGFADMDKFFIYFYGDGGIVNNKTEVKLQSYRLDTEYEPKLKKTLDYKEFENHEFEKIKAGFKVESSREDKLHGYGYQLKLTNH